MTSHSTRCLLAVSLFTDQPSLAEQARRAREDGADLLELRLDRLDPATVANALPELKALPLIVTVRAAEEGGGWQGSVADKLALLERFRDAAAYIDLELDLWERDEATRAWVRRLLEVEAGRRPRLILSWHDFAEPDPAAEGRLGRASALLGAVARRMAASPAEVEKLVCTSADVQESLAVLTMPAVPRPRIALAMGPNGLVSRVLTGAGGGLLTFATLDGRAGSAPGQPSLHELREVYRISRISATTPVLGVLGWPVTHSRSPRIHNAALAAEGRDGVYLPLAVASDGDALDAVLRHLLLERALPVHGLSVTLPHKESVLAWLRRNGQAVSAGAAACGAVNTIVRRDGRWHGENSDVVGVRAALDEAGWRADGPVTILGAGGVARAALAALGDQARQTTVYNRTRSRAETLAADFGCAVGDWATRDGAEGGLLINCTSVGMSPDEGSVPLSVGSVGRYGTVFDTIYTPERTQLLRVAEGAGVVTASGVTMFIAQAAQQYRWWFGVEPPAGVYRTALRVST